MIIKKIERKKKYNYTNKQKVQKSTASDYSFISLRRLFLLIAAACAVCTHICAMHVHAEQCCHHCVFFFLFCSLGIKNATKKRWNEMQQNGWFFKRVNIYQIKKF